jgi:hypothetical protein
MEQMHKDYFTTKELAGKKVVQKAGRPSRIIKLKF